MALPWDVLTACLGLPTAPNDLGQVILRRNEPEVEIAICKSLASSDFAETLRGVLQDWDGDAAALFSESHSALMNALRQWKVDAASDYCADSAKSQLQQQLVPVPAAPPPSPVTLPTSAGTTDESTLDFLLEAARQLSQQQQQHTPRVAPRFRPSLESCSTEDGTSGGGRTPAAGGKKCKNNNKWADFTCLAAVSSHLTAAASNPFDALRISQLAATAAEIESSADALIARICQIGWAAMAVENSSQVVVEVEIPQVVEQVLVAKRNCLAHLRRALQAALGLERPKRQEEGVEGFAAWDAMIFKLCADEADEGGNGSAVAASQQRNAMRQMLISHYLEG